MFVLMHCSLMAANEKINFSPGKEHLERHNQIVSKYLDRDDTYPSSFVTPTKSPASGKLSGSDIVINIPRSAVKLPLDSEKDSEVCQTSINTENLLQELIHSKLLLASIAAELQEERHLVNVLSKANQRYAEKVDFIICFTMMMFISSWLDWNWIPLMEAVQVMTSQIEAIVHLL